MTTRHGRTRTLSTPVTTDWSSSVASRSASSGGLDLEDRHAVALDVLQRPGRHELPGVGASLQEREVFDDPGLGEDRLASRDGRPTGVLQCVPDAVRHGRQRVMHGRAARLGVCPTHPSPPTCSLAPSASSREVSTRRCGPSGPSGGTPRFMVSGSGPYLTDADGRTYVDLVSSWGPMILGHAHPAVVDAVQRAAASGLSFGTPTGGEIELAEEIVARVAPVQQVRLVNSGTEATMSAIRLARGFTGRRRIVKFAGCYHGHVDALLAVGRVWRRHVRPAGLGRRHRRRRRPTRSCCPTTTSPRCRPASPSSGDEIACVITEAAAGNMGAVAPVAGLQRGPARRHRCRRRPADHGRGDDRVPRLRRPVGTAWTRVEADLFTFGKVMSGGLPAAAFGGRADVMAHLAPAGPVYQAGTLSGNPVAVAAGLATCGRRRGRLPRRSTPTRRRSAAWSVRALTEAGVEHQVQYAGNLFSVFFAGAPGDRLRGAQAAATWRYKPFFHSMLDAGVYLPPSAFEAWFVNAAMDEAAIAQIADALPAAARAAAAATP